MRVLSLFITCVIALLTGVSAQGSDWRYRDLGDGVKSAVALGSNDVHQVTYLTENNVGYVFYSKYDRVLDLFTMDTISSGQCYGPCDMEVDKLNYPHVSFHDHNLNDGDVSHFSYNGTTWNHLPVNHDGHDGWDSEIAFDSNNKTHLISIDPYLDSNSIEYAVYDGSNFIFESIKTKSGLMYGFGFLLVTGNVPHISYYDDAEKQLY